MNKKSDQSLSFILDELITQSLRRRLDRNYIKLIEKIQKPITFSEYVNTGVIMPCQTYKYQYNKDIVFIDGVKDICRYAGDHIIQFLPDGTYSYDGMVFKKAVECEEAIWNKIKNNFGHNINEH